MRRSPSRFAASATLCLLLAACQNISPGQPSPGAESDQAGTVPAAYSDPTPTSGLVTLYAFDPIQQTIRFDDGGLGSLIQGHEVKNRNAQLQFHGYRPDTFAVGISGGEQGAIVDLGLSSDLGELYGVTETIGLSQAFASIRLQGKSIVIGGIREEDQTRSLGGLDALLELDQNIDEAKAELGHVYLARLYDDSEEAGCIVKFVVVEHEPEVLATIRWERLDV
ncbi:MAG: hypothetical protein ACYS26_06960 [Planctomycetota bacterium]|jgi:anti-anti-sigma regulatory factor